LLSLFAGVGLLLMRWSVGHGYVRAADAQFGSARPRPAAQCSASSRGGVALVVVRLAAGIAAATFAAAIGRRAYGVIDSTRDLRQRGGALAVGMLARIPGAPRHRVDPIGALRSGDAR
jgi:hypothetical protein